MAEAHKDLDMIYDRQLLEDVLDSPDLRYIALYMFEIRKELFQDLIDDDLIESFDLLLNLDIPTIFDIRKVCSESFIKDLVRFNIFSNVKNYNTLINKPDDFKVRIAKGIRLLHQELDELEEEIHIFFKEDFLLRIITPNIPEITLNKVHKALERMRAMMCPKTNVIHPLVHKYGEEWVIDDSFYYILEELGNPYQALKIELMIRQMSDKYKEIEQNLDVYLSLFHPELQKAKLIKKCREAKKKNERNYVKYLVKKSRKSSLPTKFYVEFPEGETPSDYIQWKFTLNELIVQKLLFDDIDQNMDELRRYYSGKNQIMPYMKFIEETSFNDEISEKVKSLLIDARNNLKKINDSLADYSKKELKLLNLKIEQLIIENGLDENLEDD